MFYECWQWITYIHWSRILLLILWKCWNKFLFPYNSDMFICWSSLSPVSFPTIPCLVLWFSKWSRIISDFFMCPMQSLHQATKSQAIVYYLCWYLGACTCIIYCDSKTGQTMSLKGIMQWLLFHLTRIIWHSGDNFEDWFISNNGGRAVTAKK